MAPPLEFESPEWWRARLGRKLDERQAPMQMLQDYYDGKHPLAFASEKFREAFGGRLRAFSVNFCPMVVEAVVERLTVTGFRMGGERDLKADNDAWRIWQANQLDARSELAHRESLIKGCAYVIVSPFAADMIDDQTPLITIEDPMEVAVETAPGTRRRRAALKRWKDDEGYLRAVLWLPGELYRWRSATPYRGSATANVAWEEFALPEDGEGGFPIRLMRPDGSPFNEIPVVPLPNQPLRDGSFDSEFRVILPAQDAINKTAADLLVASEFASFRQRYILNLDLEIDPETKQPRAPFKVGVDRLLVIGRQLDDQGNAMPGGDVSVGSFDVSDLKPYINSIEMWVQNIATRTRTPAHYLLGSAGTFPSGESLRATETGLVAKTKKKMPHLGEGWEEVERLAFDILGDPRAAIVDSETIWADPEYRTEAEHVDALVKLKSIGVPDEQLWEDAGYSPQQIARFQEIAARNGVALPPAVALLGPGERVATNGTAPPELTAAGGPLP